MKILHVIGGGQVGGAKTHVLSLLEELTKDPVLKVKLICLMSGEFAEEAKRLYIDSQILDSRNILVSLYKLIKIIRRENFEIVHSHGTKANLLVGISKFFTSTKIVTTIHSDYKYDYMHSTFRRLTLGNINKIIIKLFDYYVTISKKFREILVSQNFNPDKIFVLYNGIKFNIPLRIYSKKAFINRNQLDIKKSDIIVGTLARLHPVKKISTLLDAAYIVLQKNINVLFLIGGEGTEKEFLERHAKRLGISDKVYFLGNVNDPDEFVNFIDINVLTSISESFPYAILEAARSKKPTISSNVGGIPDIIDNGINGYLFNAGDHEQLAHYILELCNHPEIRITIGENIYYKAKNYFSVQNMASTQKNIYRTIHKLSNHISSY